MSRPPGQGGRGGEQAEMSSLISSLMHQRLLHPWRRTPDDDDFALERRWVLGQGCHHILLAVKHQCLALELEALLACAAPKCGVVVSGGQFVLVSWPAAGQAAPRCHTPVILATEPSGARLPYRIWMWPVDLMGASMGRITSWPAFMSGTRAKFWPMVLPAHGPSSQLCSPSARPGQLASHGH